MTKTQINQIIKRIDSHMLSVAKDRDNLDDFISELEGLKENCREAWDSLQIARDALSCLV